MENSFGNCSTSTLDADGEDRFKNQLNSTALVEEGRDNNVSFAQPRTPPRVDLKFSPILHVNDDKGKSVFTRRMAMCKNRGESPLAKSVTRADLHDISSIQFCKNDSESGYLSRVNESEYDTSKENMPETSTPKKLNTTRMNPFESRFIDSIHLSTLSPSLFESSSCSTSKDDPAVLSIEARAALMPADITSEEARLCYYSPDPVVEARIHASLDVYWKSNIGHVHSPDGPRPTASELAPSPTSTERDSVVSKVRSTYTSPHCRPNVGRKRVMTKRNTMSQTEITIAPTFDFDFKKLLGASCVYNDEEDSPEEEFNVSVMNTSLPRKLFFDGKDDTTNSLNESDIDDRDRPEIRCDFDDGSFHAQDCDLVDFGLSPIKGDSDCD